MFYDAISHEHRGKGSILPMKVMVLIARLRQPEVFAL
jgi:hypothetical protein